MVQKEKRENWDQEVLMVSLAHQDPPVQVVKYLSQEVLEWEFTTLWVVVPDQEVNKVSKVLEATRWDEISFKLIEVLANFLHRVLPEKMEYLEGAIQKKTWEIFATMFWEVNLKNLLQTYRVHQVNIQA